MTDGVLAMRPPLAQSHSLAEFSCVRRPWSSERALPGARDTFLSFPSDIQYVAISSLCPSWSCRDRETSQLFDCVSNVDLGAACYAYV